MQYAAGVNWSRANAAHGRAVALTTTKDFYSKAWVDLGVVFGTDDLDQVIGREESRRRLGDATMSPYEITYPNGSVEHWNDEPGAVWMQRVLDVYSHAVWLNPVKESYWRVTPSVQVMRQIMGGRMYSLTLDGLDSAMRELSH